MNNALQVFQNEQFGQVRVIEKDGEPWVVAKDVAVALGYGADSKMGMIFKHVPDAWKGVNPIYTPGGMQEMLTISEQGLYFFLGRSDKKDALPFQMWLAGDVVPSIRKTGGYALPRVEKPSAKTIAETRTVFKALNGIAKDFGLDKNAAAISAAQGTKKVTGVDVMALLEVTAIEAPTQEKHFTPTQLGGMFGGKSGKAINKALEAAGMQKRTPHRAWIVTEKGKAFSRLFDTTKQHSDGAPVTQIKWSESVLNELK